VRSRAYALVATVAVVMAAACSSPGPATTLATQPAATSAESAPLRLSGTVEAVQATTVTVPRLQGPAVPLLIVGLVEPGTRVAAGDPLVEFDRQQQERDAFDRRAELINLDSDITKKRAEQTALDAKDRTELTAAEHDVERAQLEVRQNDLVARIEAEKNTLGLEQARARLAQLQKTYTLKRAAAAADLQILEIRRARAARALSYAEGNAKLMLTPAPFGGLVVVKRTYRNGSFVEIARGDEVRPGTPIVDIVDTTSMRVRARVNQADVSLVHVGQAVKIGLDGFPELSFNGQITSLAPLAAASGLSQDVRSFVAVVSIEGSHAQLLPDLTASIDIPATPGPAVARVAAGRLP
jgi:multidrug resistance efflux pump